MKRRIGILRFVLGSVMGVFGLGLLGTAFFPIRWGALILGIVLLGLGLFLAVGTISTRRRPP